MKFYDWAKTIDLSQPATASIDDNRLFDEFNIVPMDFFDLEQYGFSEYYIDTWICTDQNVGTSILFYNGAPVALCEKPYRKSNTTYKWVNAHIANTIANVLRHIATPTSNNVELIDLEEDITFD